jgi:hypothetical protein
MRHKCRAPGCPASTAHYIFGSDVMPHAAPQAMKTKRAVVSAQRLGVRQSPGAFGGAPVAKAAEDCRSPRRFARTHPTAIFWSAFRLGVLGTLGGIFGSNAMPHAAPQAMKTERAVVSAQRLGVRQSAGAFGGAPVAKAAEDCRSPRRFARTHPAAILGSAGWKPAHRWQKRQRTAAVQDASRAHTQPPFSGQATKVPCLPAGA